MLQLVHLFYISSHICSTPLPCLYDRGINEPQQVDEGPFEQDVGFMIHEKTIRNLATKIVSNSLLQNCHW